MAFEWQDPTGLPVQRVAHQLFVALGFIDAEPPQLPGLADVLAAEPFQGDLRAALAGWTWWRQAAARHNRLAAQAAEAGALVERLEAEAADLARRQRELFTPPGPRNLAAELAALKAREAATREQLRQQRETAGVLAGAVRKAHAEAAQAYREVWGQCVARLRTRLAAQEAAARRRLLELLRPLLVELLRAYALCTEAALISGDLFDLGGAQRLEDFLAEAEPAGAPAEPQPAG